MYHAVVRRRVRRLWRRIGRGDYRAAVAIAAPDLDFRFVAEPPVGVRLRGPQEFESWFAELFRLFGDLRLTLTDLVVRGWPWNTTVVVRLDITATLATGERYTNEAIQWVNLRWGRMVSDVVMEDTAKLERACRVQWAAEAASGLSLIHI